MRRLGLAAYVSMGCVIGTPAFGGVIRGTLHVPASVSQQAGAVDAYPGHAHSMPGMHNATRGLASDAVIYIEAIRAELTDSLAASAPPTPRLAQKGQMFEPRVVAVAVDCSVDFPNQDPIYHNVFSLSPTRRFDLGKYPKGQSRRVEFRKQGVVNVYCDIHSNMAAFILVVPNRAFTQPNATGEFALPDLPHGSYVLHAWHPDFEPQTTRIEIPATGDVVTSVSF